MAKKGAKKNATPPEKQVMRPSKSEGDAARQVISATALKRIANEVLAYKNQASTANGNAGQTIKDWVSKGLNAPMFSIAARLYKRGKNDAVKLRIDLDDLLYYIDALGLNDLAAPMFDAARRTETAIGSSEDGGGESLPDTSRELEAAFDAGRMQ